MSLIDQLRQLIDDLPSDLGTAESLAARDAVLSRFLERTPLPAALAGLGASRRILSVQYELLP